MKKIPKGKTPSLVGFSNGRPCKVDVLRKCECCRCCAELLVGADCFNIPKKSAGFTKECRYCMDCYTKIIEQTQIELTELKNL